MSLSDVIYRSTGLANEFDLPFTWLVISMSDWTGATTMTWRSDDDLFDGDVGIEVEFIPEYSDIAKIRFAR